MSHFRYGIEYSLIRGMRVIKLLNLIPYNKSDARKLLEREFHWRDYGCKHFESRWTRYFQGWWLRTKFGYDKRLAHLSSLILSGQITRDAALKEIHSEVYSQSMMAEDRDLILKKLGMSEKEWDQIVASPVHGHDEYPTSEWMTKTLMAGRVALRRAGLIR